MRLNGAQGADGIPAWPDGFHQFSLHHAGVVTVLIAAMVVSCRLGRRWRGSEKESRLARAWGVLILVSMVGLSAYWLMPSRFNPEISLPLQVCDLSAYIAGVAMLTRWRWFKTITVFWGLALSTQAFVTPIVRVGPTTFHFYYFWVSHTFIVGSAVYLIAVQRYRGTWGDLWTALVSMAAYAGLVQPMDTAYGWNYGFMGDSKPGARTILDSLGAWPIRIYWLGGLSACAMIVVMIGFEAGRVFSGRRSGTLPRA